MSAGARVLTEREFSRKSFLRGGGSLVIGLSVAGAAAQAAGAANNPTAIAASHTGALPGPPDATQVDSWLQVNSDNTVTLFAGWTELGQGTPTAVRMIAAEELGLVDGPGDAGAGRHERVARRRSRSAAPRPRPRWARRACAGLRPLRGRCS